MNGKRLFPEIAEMIDRHLQRGRADREGTVGTLHRLRHLLRWLTPNGGTLLLVAVLILTQRVWARPLASSTPAAVGPSATTVNYQGRLADSGGSPLSGSYGMSFSLWDAPSDGNLVWGPEAHVAVPVSEGLFNVGLGSQTGGGIPTSAWGGDRYLEVAVGGETLSPRELIRSVPIAGMALTVPDGAISSAKMAPTLFSASTPGEVPVSESPTEVLALPVDLQVDGVCLIFVQISGMVDQPGGIRAVLRDGDGVEVSGSTIHTQHPSAGPGGTQSGSVAVTHALGRGAHTLKLYASGPGTVRSAHIIAIPFAQAP